MQNGYFIVHGRTATDNSFQHEMETLDEVIDNFLAYAKNAKISVSKESLQDNMKRAFVSNIKYTLADQYSHMTANSVTIDEYDLIVLSKESETTIHA